MSSTTKKSILAKMAYATDPKRGRWNCEFEARPFYILSPRLKKREEQKGGRGGEGGGGDGGSGGSSGGGGRTTTTTTTTKAQLFQGLSGEKEGCRTLVLKQLLSP